MEIFLYDYELQAVRLYFYGRTPREAPYKNAMRSIHHS